MKTFTRKQAVAFIKKQQGDMEIAAFAKKLGVSAQLIGDLYRGKLPPGKSLGFRKVVSSIRYERIAGDDNAA